MNQQLLFDNLTNPALLFFTLGIVAVKLKSDLEIPTTTAKFISLYLLFSIGFKGGQELAHSKFTAEIVLTIIFAILAAILIPIYVFFLPNENWVLITQEQLPHLMVLLAL